MRVRTICVLLHDTLKTSRFFSASYEAVQGLVTWCVRATRPRLAVAGAKTCRALLAVNSGAHKCESKSSAPCSSQATADAGHEVPEKGCTVRLDAGGALWRFCLLPDQLGRHTKVSNPQTTSATPEDWHVQSYEDLRSPQRRGVWRVGVGVGVGVCVLVCVCVCVQGPSTTSLTRVISPGLSSTRPFRSRLAGVCDGSLSHGRVQPTLHTLKSLPVFCVPGPGVHQRVDQAQAGSGSQESYTRTAAHGMLARVDRTCLGHI